MFEDESEGQAVGYLYYSPHDGDGGEPRYPSTYSPCMVMAGLTPSYRFITGARAGIRQEIDYQPHILP